MLKYYLSYAILAWTSWEVLANKTNTPQGRTASTNPLLIDQVALYQQQWFAYNAVKENELQEKVARIERTIEGRLMVLQKKLNLTVHDLQDTLEKQREDTLEKLRISSRIIPEKFKKIGNRWYFFENNDTQNWFSAFNTCRRKGGHLATIYNGKELDEVFAHAPPGAYWIDINSAYSKGHYTSTLTGKKPPFFRWNDEKTENIKYNECVTVYTLKMFTPDCYRKFSFLCQAEQWEL
ncbi:accessory gland protein Acp29AB-like [Drosophila teissieri]|uniref:accessory gland protein Acp29AB-like n=1 Tax=Drosophila teissieri TaxID=7243 RepID=UPI001CB9F0DA|nr:accessory gland protein Acp29AB-like [Drosophila teissieri]